MQSEQFRELMLGNGTIQNLNQLYAGIPHAVRPVPSAFACTTTPWGIVTSPSATVDGRNGVATNQGHGLDAGASTRTA